MEVDSNFLRGVCRGGGQHRRVAGLVDEREERFPCFDRLQLGHQFSHLSSSLNLKVVKSDPKINYPILPNLVELHYNLSAQEWPKIEFFVYQNA